MAKKKWRYIQMGEDYWRSPQIRRLRKSNPEDWHLYHSIFERMVVLDMNREDHVDGFIRSTAEEPYEEEDVADMIKEHVNHVRVAMVKLQESGHIEVFQDGTIGFPMFSQLVGDRNMRPQLLSDYIDTRNRIVQGENPIGDICFESQLSKGKLSEGKSRQLPEPEHDDYRRDPDTGQINSAVRTLTDDERERYLSIYSYALNYSQLLDDWQRENLPRMVKQITSGKLFTEKQRALFDDNADKLERAVERHRRDQPKTTRDETSDEIMRAIQRSRATT